MPKVICLAGPAGPQKKNLLENLVKELSGRGLGVGLIIENFSKGRLPDFAGSQAMVEIKGGKVAACQRQEEPLSVEQAVCRFLAKTDLVISELHQKEARPKIEYVPAGARPSLAGDPGLRALVGPEPAPSDLPSFAINDIKGLSDFILKTLGPLDKLPRIRILLEGKRVPANEFVQDFVVNTIRALVGSLKGGQGPGRLEIFID
jgi:molybdopterin-guanine dinucleotide biosynthesis protein